MVNLIWMQAGCCSGDTMSILNSEDPDILEFIDRFGINVVWHPSLSPLCGKSVLEALAPYREGRAKLDVLIVEGALQEKGFHHWGPAGRFEDIVKELADQAHYTIAVGSCASWGGIAATPPNPTGAQGLQLSKKRRGGFLGVGYKSKAGLPVINIPGCPANPDWMVQTLLAVLLGKLEQIKLDEYQRPLDIYRHYVHDGCPRGDSFAFKQEAATFGCQGCMLREQGCRGTFTHADCSIRKWLKMSCNTQVGAPCIGCTEPDFPDATLPFFSYKGLPEDYPKLRYYITAGFSKLARPGRIKERAREDKKYAKQVGGK